MVDIFAPTHSISQIALNFKNIKGSANSLFTDKTYRQHWGGMWLITITLANFKTYANYKEWDNFIVEYFNTNRFFTLKLPECFFKNTLVGTPPSDIKYEYVDTNYIGFFQPPDAPVYSKIVNGNLFTIKSSETYQDQHTYSLHQIFNIGRGRAVPPGDTVYFEFNYYPDALPPKLFFFSKLQWEDLWVTCQIIDTPQPFKYNTNGHYEPVTLQLASFNPPVIAV